jgi:hypothetical protein
MIKVFSFSSSFFLYSGIISISSLGSFIVFGSGFHFPVGSHPSFSGGSGSSSSIFFSGSYIIGSPNGSSFSSGFSGSSGAFGII